MKRFFTLLLFLVSHLAFGQFHEFGLGVGGLNYAGDLMRAYHIENVKPGGVGYYKMNFDNIFSVRGSLTGGIISGSDERPIDPFASNRAASFQSGLLELAVMAEYNFIDYKAEQVKFRWSPYIALGVAGTYIFGGNQNLNGSSPVQFAIPFGGGFKFAVSPYITLNVEIGLRKMFFDYLDGYSDGDITNKNYQYGNKYDQDWYNFVGLSVSYTIWKIPCPYDFY